MTTEPGAAPSPDEIEEYRQRARAWLAQHLPPHSGHRERRRVDYFTPSALAENRARQRTLFDGGYAGITWPTDYGGQGLTPQHEWAFHMEAHDYALPDFGALTDTTFYICVPTMIAHASAELLTRLVPSVLAGEALVCQFFSEPSGGSDLAGARTRATRDGDQWVLNGQKIWSTFAHLADWGMCLARTDWEAPKHRGLTWFLVQRDAPGLTVRPIQQINEVAEFCEEFFDDVVVPDENVIGQVNDGWSVAQTMLVYERGAGRPDDGVPLGGPGPIAPDLLTVAERAGRTSDPEVRQLLARAHTNDYVGKVLGSRIAEMGRLGRLTPGMAAYGKLFRGTFGPIRARMFVEIGGLSAMTWLPDDPQGPVASLTYLNGRAGSIAGGTNEMQRNAIAERALGLPREPSFDTKKPFSQVLRDAKDWTGQS